jgi:hypothetical protein
MVTFLSSHTFIFWEIDFSKLCQRLQSLVKKTQGILGVKAFLDSCMEPIGFEL